MVAGRVVYFVVVVFARSRPNFADAAPIFFSDRDSPTSVKCKNETHESFDVRAELSRSKTFFLAVVHTSSHTLETGVADSKQHCCWCISLVSASFRPSLLPCILVSLQMSFPANMPLVPSTPPPPLPTVACEFHRDFSYTDEGFHQDGLEWHFEDSRRCVKVMVGCRRRRRRRCCCCC